MATPTIADLLTVYPESDSALQRHGALVRNYEEQEVWRIFDLDGNVAHDEVASDHDAMWLANVMVGGIEFADAHER